MIENTLSRLLLEYMPFPEKRYNPLVLVCKNKTISNEMIDKFKLLCKKEKMDIVNGMDLILKKTPFSSSDNYCVMFENLQIIAGIPEYEQNFFELYNSLWNICAPIVITINDYPRLLKFEGRNHSRLNWGIKSEIL